LFRNDDLLIFRDFSATAGTKNSRSVPKLALIHVLSRNINLGGNGRENFVLGFRGISIFLFRMSTIILKKKSFVSRRKGVKKSIKIKFNKDHSFFSQIFLVFWKKKFSRQKKNFAGKISTWQKSF
jgi:hypothetical protein